MMLFPFLKYVSPVYSFNLRRNDGSYVFPKYDALPEHIRSYISLDENFSGIEVSKLDASWRAIRSGYLGDVEGLTDPVEPNLEDNYRFLRKYFDRRWVLYTLILRLLSLHNPIREFQAWWKTRSVSRFSYVENQIPVHHWNSFQSELLREKPLVSVVIPTLNRYKWLDLALKDLEMQDYRNFEVLVVDQSVPFEAAFYDTYNLDFKLIRQEEPALWLARNTAIERARGQYILLFDDDSRVEKDWISNHLKCMDFFSVLISSGISHSTSGGMVVDNYKAFRMADFFDTGNAMVHRSVFSEIGLFDRQFERQRMGDGEFGLRALSKGYINVSNPTSSRLHLKVSQGGLRQLGSWDAMRPVNWFAPRPIPSVLYLYRRYFGKALARMALLKSIPPSLIPYRYKGNKGMLVIGYLLSLLLFPILFIQVSRSWYLAGKKIKQGPKIDTLS